MVDAYNASSPHQLERSGHNLSTPRPRDCIRRQWKSKRQQGASYMIRTAVHNISPNPAKTLMHPAKRLVGNPVFAQLYRAQMQIPLTANPMRLPGYGEQIARARLTAIQAIENGLWFAQPLISRLNQPRKPSANNPTLTTLPLAEEGTAAIQTYAALTQQATGDKHCLNAADFQAWLDHTKNLHQQPLLADPAKIRALNHSIDQFAAQQRTPEAIGQVLAEVLLDFNAEKTAELDERFETEQRHTTLSQSSIEDLINGQLQYGVSAAGVVVAPVVNFGSLLDVQQKTVHALRHGIKVTWLVRQGEAAQQVTREILRLHHVLAQAGLADMLDVVVLSIAQRDEFFQTIGLPTLATGRADSMIAIQQAAADSATSGSGNSADISLDADISLSTPFAHMVMRDATVAGNGRQCTALQVAIVNALPSTFAALAAQQLTLHATPAQANQAAFENQHWFAAYASDAPALPAGTTRLPVAHDSLVFYDASQQLLGEEVSWGKLGIGLLNAHKLSLIIDYVRRYPWLSMGYAPNLTQLKTEIGNFLAILQASKATVGTFNGPCVFSAPQHPGEIFAEATTHRQGNLLISHSPMQAPVPRGAQLWGPSASYLAQQSQQASAIAQQLASGFNLTPVELGYLVEMQKYLEDAAKPHVYHRQTRGPSVEGFAIRTADDKVSKLIPQHCYTLHNPISPLDIAVGLLLLTQTNWQQCTQAVLIDPVHQALLDPIQQFLRAQQFQGDIRLCRDPQRAETTDVEAFVSTRFHAQATYRQVDDVIAGFGARMMHIKFLNAPDDQAIDIFTQQATRNFPWLQASLGYKPTLTASQVKHG